MEQITSSIRKRRLHLCFFMSKQPKGVSSALTPLLYICAMTPFTKKQTTTI